MSQDKLGDLLLSTYLLLTKLGSILKEYEDFTVLGKQITKMTAAY